MKKIILSVVATISTLLVLGSIPVLNDDLDYYNKLHKEAKSIEMSLPLGADDWDQHAAIVDQNGLLPSSVKNRILVAMNSLSEVGLSCKLVVLDENGNMLQALDETWEQMNGGNGDLLVVIKVSEGIMQFEQSYGKDVLSLLSLVSSWKYSLESAARYYQTDQNLGDLAWAYESLQRYCSSPYEEVGVDWAKGEVVGDLLFMALFLSIDILLIFLFVRSSKNGKTVQNASYDYGGKDNVNCGTVENALESSRRLLPLRTNQSEVIISIHDERHILSKYIKEVR